MSIGFSRQEYWSGWPFPFPVDFLASYLFPSYTLKAISFPHSDHDLLIDFAHGSLSFSKAFFSQASSATEALHFVRFLPGPKMQLQSLLLFEVSKEREGALKKISTRTCRN